MQRFGFSLLATALLLCGPLARATIFGNIRGIVHDPQHRPIAGADVKLQSANSDWSRTAKTDSDGEFEFDAVPVGEYTIALSKQDFRDVSQHLTVQSGSSHVLHFPMELAGVSQRVEVQAAAETLDTNSSTTQTLINSATIQATPGANRANSLSMITDNVPGSYMVHDQLHIRGGHQVSWLIDGVPVPNTSIASNVGPQFDPKDVDYFEVQRGGFAADYGDRTYAVLNVIPRTGFDRDNEAEIVTSYGSYNQTDNQISFGSHTQRFAYYTSVSGNRSDYSLETPVPQVIHDLGDGIGGFGSLMFNVTPNDQLRLVSSIRGDFYQVPNTPELELTGTRDTERERDAFVNFSWVHVLNPGSVLTVSPFYHYNSANYAGGPDDAPVIPTQDRASNYLGMQSTYTFVKGKNNFRTGFYIYGQRDNAFFAIAPALNTPPPVPPALSQRELLWGNLEAIFLQDQIKATPWLTLNLGARLTHYGALVSENAADPRVGAAIQIPRLHWIIRGSYGRYYQAPPLDTVSGPLLDFALEQGFDFLPLHGERDEQWEVGLAIPFRGWVLDTDYFHTTAKNFLDHDVLGNSNIFFPLTIDRARIHGWETTLRSPLLFRRARVNVVYSHQYTQGWGPITGGLTDFQPPPDSYYYLDHDQRDTLAAGYTFQLPWNAYTTGMLNYGSGFLEGDGPGHLPPHATFNLTIGKTFRERLSLTFTAINISNNRFLLDTSNTFGGTHWNEPRQFIGQVQWRFHY